ncbi:MAG: hypothetical protein ABMA02_00775 [Saprospiraceae bacterium]
MEFEVLKDLVQTITRNKIKNIEVLGNPDSEKNLISEMHEGIFKGQFASDNEAARHLYGTNEKDPNYKKLRNRLIRQLINTSFFVDTNLPQYNERGKASFTCYREYAAAYIIWSKDATKASHYLLQQLLEQTIKFEFTALTADICRLLRHQSALSPGDQVSHEKYTILHQLYEEKRYWEAKSFDYTETLNHHYITRRSPSKEVNALASQYFDELFPHLASVGTIQFQIQTYHIGLIKHFSANDCKSALALCDEALNLLKTRPNANRGGLSSFAFHKLICLTQLRIEDEGDKTINYCLTLVDPGNFNWFRLLETQFYYYTYFKKYEQALRVFEEAVGHPKYLLLSGSARDMWVMIGGYLHILAIFGKLDKNDVETAAGYFNPFAARFLNDFEILDKEKDGMNIPLVLLPVLYSVAKGLYEEEAFRRSVEALDKYRKRYLENDTNRRSAIFLKLLLAIAKREFAGERAETKIQKERELLKKEPPEIAGQSFAIEVIPYEDLLEMLLQAQKNQAHLGK